MTQDMKSRKKISIESKGSFKVNLNHPTRNVSDVEKQITLPSHQSVQQNLLTCLLKCHKEGHFASVCRTKVSNESDNKKKINYTRKDQESKEGDNEYTFVVNHQSDENGGLVDIKVGGVLCNFLIDSGSMCNAINKSCWEKLKAKRRFIHMDQVSR